MTEPGVIVADAFVEGVRRAGVEPDARLRLLAWAVGRSAPVVDDPHGLGALHESTLDDGERTRRGAWYTPRWLADELVSHVVTRDLAAGPIVDPACGGGAFLLAVADRLRGFGVAPDECVRRLRGLDVDPVAVAVAEAALWWWSARAGAPTVAGEALAVGDALCAPARDPAAAVVGNPPFLGQLRRTTAVDDERRAHLRHRFGSALRPYTDPAWLFLLAAAEALVPGGRVGLVQPESLLAARDAADVRRALDELADLVTMVVDDGSAFEAGVVVCAPVLERRPGSRRRNDWTGHLADARGVPRVPVTDGPTLGSVATVRAGFRDEYYGLVDAVCDGGPGRPLVTAGRIDPFRLLDRPQRFAGRRWDDPRVDVARVRGRAARWVAVQESPKVLVATQTRVIEAVPDPSGVLVGSVPVLCVTPHDPDFLWHVLAALQAPTATAWLLRRSAGTALSTGACKPTAALLTDLPLPVDAQAWDRAAMLAEEVADTGGGHDRFARAAEAAYGTGDPVVREWWAQRCPRR